MVLIVVETHCLGIKNVSAPDLPTKAVRGDFYMADVGIIPYSDEFQQMNVAGLYNNTKYLRVKKL